MFELFLIAFVVFIALNFPKSFLYLFFVPMCGIVLSAGAWSICAMIWSSLITFKMFGTFILVGLALAYSIAFAVND